MPQLSLYIDDKTMSAVRRNAKLQNSSLSQYVVGVLRKTAVDGGWPTGYWSLAGAVEDDGFVRPEQPPFEDDAPRASL